ncbi:MAG: xanthine dehydrogenase family protein molybdopterin-binding subunit [Alphaproteobacteria bacterium]|nr:xanthine dehydrogenase family protein molybdopterin-binding subunit [Alphaproteobacteria bacterium]
MDTTGRREDDRLLRGEGRFTADRRPDGLCHVAFLRSPHPHARIASIATTTAAEMPGVLAVLTSRDLAADGVGDLPSVVPYKRPDGAPAPRTPRPLLARDIVRHVGEPVAMVVARSHAQAVDAVERIDVAFESLPAVIRCDAARAAGAPALWPDAPDNVAFIWRHGDRDGVAAAISGAAHVTRLVDRVSRVAACPMEPRVIVARPLADGRLEVHAATQTPFALRNGLARLLGLEPSRLRVVAGDVGGAFGMKADVAREDGLVCWAARRLGVPVRWLSERGEGFISDDQARDVAFEAVLALDGDGKFVALQVGYAVNVGAYASGRSLGAITNIGGIAGVYRTPLIAAEVHGVLTNTLPTAPYRGAGRPDATYVIERTIDLAATELGLDPIELRRRNLIPAAAMPYRTGLLFEYDCGDFAANMDEAHRLADLAGYPARKAASARRGRLRGLGVCNPIEVAGGPYSKVLPDSARLVVNPDGRVHLFTGAMSVGQGLETAWPRIVAARLGIPADRCVYHQGDTDEIETGRGSGGSAGLCVSGTAMSLAVEETLRIARDLAAEHLEAAVADLEFAAGAFRVVGTDRGVALAELAALAAAGQGDRPDAERGLVAAAAFQPPRVTFPNGCHVCEVEVDPETGAVEVQSYAVVEDIGRVLNPDLVHGQIHGGVAQGMGQALMEEIRYEPGSAQLLTGSFMDYPMPRAADVPAIAIATREVPTAVNPLGAKGVGEAGTVGSLAATINAICDALAPLGVRRIEMPATPARVWAAIEAARRARGGGAG